MKTDLGGRGREDGRPPVFFRTAATPRPRFITSMGKDLVMKLDDGGTLDVGRYGVWEFDTRREKYQVVESGNDLEALQAKWGPGLVVHGIGPWVHENEPGALEGEGAAAAGMRRTAEPDDDEVMFEEAARLAGFETEVGGGGALVLFISVPGNRTLAFGFANGPLGYTVMNDQGEAVDGDDMPEGPTTVEAMAEYIRGVTRKWKATQKWPGSPMRTTRFPGPLEGEASSAWRARRAAGRQLAQGDLLVFTKPATVKSVDGPDRGFKAGDRVAVIGRGQGSVILNDEQDNDYLMPEGQAADVLRPVAMAGDHPGPLEAGSRWRQRLAEAPPAIDEKWVLRNDATRAVVVSRVEGGEVYFFAEGGGFGMSGPLDKFLKDFRRPTKSDERLRGSLVPAVFFLEGMDERFSGFRFPGDSWNGWAVPYFTKDVAKRFIKTEGGPAVTSGYDDATDSFWLKLDPDGDETERFPGQDIGGRHLYNMGGGFTWEIAEDAPGPLEGEASARRAASEWGEAEERRFTDKLTGKVWNVRAVFSGSKFGRGHELVHGEPEPLVEFYDTAYFPGAPGGGQFVSRYYLSTLLNSSADGLGLDLHGGANEWKIMAETMSEIIDWLRGEIAARRPGPMEGEAAARGSSRTASVRGVAVELANEFSKGLAESITPSQMRLVRMLNRIEPVKDVCHSHDFCDANMVMAEAYERVRRRHPEMPKSDVTIEPFAGIWNQAWDMAKANGFRPVSEVPEDPGPLEGEARARGTARRAEGGAINIQVPGHGPVRFPAALFHEVVEWMVLFGKGDVPKDSEAAMRLAERTYEALVEALGDKARDTGVIGAAQMAVTRAAADAAGGLPDTSLGQRGPMEGEARARWSVRRAGAVRTASRADLVTPDVSVEKGGLRLSLEYIGEGSDAEFNDQDPNDIPWARMSVEARQPDGTWTEVDLSSYCTLIPADTPQDAKRAVAATMLDMFIAAMEQGRSVKGICEELSSTNLDFFGFRQHRPAEGPMEGEAAARAGLGRRAYGGWQRTKDDTWAWIWNRKESGFRLTKGSWIRIIDTRTRRTDDQQPGLAFEMRERPGIVFWTTPTLLENVARLSRSVSGPLEGEAGARWRQRRAAPELGPGERWRTDAEIASDYQDMKIIEFKFNPRTWSDGTKGGSGHFEVEFPSMAGHDDSGIRYDRFIVYDLAAGKVAFDQWYPEPVDRALRALVLSRVKVTEAPGAMEGEALAAAGMPRAGAREKVDWALDNDFTDERLWTSPDIQVGSEFYQMFIRHENMDGRGWNWHAGVTRFDKVGYPSIVEEIPAADRRDAIAAARRLMEKHSGVQAPGPMEGEDAGPERTAASDSVTFLIRTMDENDGKGDLITQAAVTKSVVMGGQPSIEAELVGHLISVGRLPAGSVPWEGDGDPQDFAMWPKRPDGVVTGFWASLSELDYGKRMAWESDADRRLGLRDAARSGNLRTAASSEKQYRDAIISVLSEGTKPGDKVAMEGDELWHDVLDRLGEEPGEGDDQISRFNLAFTSLEAAGLIEVTRGEFEEDVDIRYAPAGAAKRISVTPGALEGEASARWRARRAESQFPPAPMPGEIIYQDKTVPAWNDRSSRVTPDKDPDFMIPAGDPIEVVEMHRPSGWVLVEHKDRGYWVRWVALLFGRRPKDMGGAMEGEATARGRLVTASAWRKMTEAEEDRFSQVTTTYRAEVLEPATLYLDYKNPYSPKDGIVANWVVISFFGRWIVQMYHQLLTGDEAPNLMEAESDEHTFPLDPDMSIEQAKDEAVRILREEIEAESDRAPRRSVEEVPMEGEAAAAGALVRVGRGKPYVYDIHKVLAHQNDHGVLIDVANRTAYMGTGDVTEIMEAVSSYGFGRVVTRPRNFRDQVLTWTGHYHVLPQGDVDQGRWASYVLRVHGMRPDDARHLDGLIDAAASSRSAHPDAAMEGEARARWQMRRAEWVGGEFLKLPKDIFIVRSVLDPTAIGIYHGTKEQVLDYWFSNMVESGEFEQSAPGIDPEMLTIEQKRAEVLKAYELEWVELIDLTGMNAEGPMEGEGAARGLRRLAADMDTMLVGIEKKDFAGIAGQLMAEVVLPLAHAAAKIWDAEVMEDMGRGRAVIDGVELVGSRKSGKPRATSDWDFVVRWRTEPAGDPVDADDMDREFGRCVQAALDRGALGPDSDPRVRAARMVDVFTEYGHGGPARTAASRRGNWTSRRAAPLTHKWRVTWFDPGTNRREVYQSDLSQAAAHRMALRLKTEMAVRWYPNTTTNEFDVRIEPMPRTAAGRRPHAWAPGTVLRRMTGDVEGFKFLPPRKQYPDERRTVAAWLRKGETIEVWDLLNGMAGTTKPNGVTVWVAEDQLNEWSVEMATGDQPEGGLEGEASVAPSPLSLSLPNGVVLPVPAPAAAELRGLFDYWKTLEDFSRSVPDDKKRRAWFDEANKIKQATFFRRFDAIAYDLTKNYVVGIGHPERAVQYALSQVMEGLFQALIADRVARGNPMAAVGTMHETSGGMEGEARARWTARRAGAGLRIPDGTYALAKDILVEGASSFLSGLRFPPYTLAAGTKVEVINEGGGQLYIKVWNQERTSYMPYRALSEKVAPGITGGALRQTEGPMEGEAAAAGRTVTALNRKRVWMSKRPDIISGAYDGLRMVLGAVNVTGISQLVLLGFIGEEMDAIFNAWMTDDSQDPVGFAIDWWTNDTLPTLVWYLMALKQPLPAELVDAAKTSDNWDQDAFKARSGPMVSEPETPLEGEAGARWTARRAESVARMDWMRNVVLFEKDAVGFDSEARGPDRDVDVHIPKGAKGTIKSYRSYKDSYTMVLDDGRSVAVPEAELLRTTRFIGKLSWEDEGPLEGEAGASGPMVRTAADEPMKQPYPLWPKTIGKLTLGHTYVLKTDLPRHRVDREGGKHPHPDPIPAGSEVRLVHLAPFGYGMVEIVGMDPKDRWSRAVVYSDLLGKAAGFGGGERPGGIAGEASARAAGKSFPCQECGHVRSLHAQGLGACQFAPTDDRGRQEPCPCRSYVRQGARDVQTSLEGESAAAGALHTAAGALHTAAGAWRKVDPFSNEYLAHAVEAIDAFVQEPPFTYVLEFPPEQGWAPQRISMWAVAWRQAQQEPGSFSWHYQVFFQPLPDDAEPDFTKADAMADEGYEIPTNEEQAKAGAERLLAENIGYVSKGRPIERSGPGALEGEASLRVRAESQWPEKKMFFRGDGPVDGAPVQVGQRVTVTKPADETFETEHLGKQGVVVNLNYAAGIGESYPSDPFIGVALDDGVSTGFWFEELRIADTGAVQSEIFGPMEGEASARFAARPARNRVLRDHLALFDSVAASGTPAEAFAAEEFGHLCESMSGWLGRVDQDLADFWIRTAVEDLAKAGDQIAEKLAAGVEAPSITEADIKADLYSVFIVKTWVESRGLWRNAGTPRDRAAAAREMADAARSIAKRLPVPGSGRLEGEASARGAWLERRAAREPQLKDHEFVGMGADRAWFFDAMTENPFVGLTIFDAKQKRERTRDAEGEYGVPGEWVRVGPGMWVDMDDAEYLSLDELLDPDRDIIADLPPEDAAKARELAKIRMRNVRGPLDGPGRTAARRTDFPHRLSKSLRAWAEVSHEPARLPSGTRVRIEDAFVDNPRYVSPTMVRFTAEGYLVTFRAFQDEMTAAGIPVPPNTKRHEVPGGLEGEARSRALVTRTAAASMVLTNGIWADRVSPDGSELVPPREWLVKGTKIMPVGEKMYDGHPSVQFTTPGFPGLFSIYRYAFNYRTEAEGRMEGEGAARGAWLRRRGARGTDEATIRSIAEQVRAEFELAPCGDLQSKGLCQDASGTLVRYLRAAGFDDARFVDAWFTNMDKENDYWEADYGEGPLRLGHAWVQVGDLVVDVTADQFNRYLLRPMPEVYVGPAGDHYTTEPMTEQQKADVQGADRRMTRAAAPVDMKIVRLRESVQYMVASLFRELRPIEGVLPAGTVVEVLYENDGRGYAMIRTVEGHPISCIVTTRALLEVAEPMARGVSREESGGMEGEARARWTARRAAAKAHYFTIEQDINTGAAIAREEVESGTMPVQEIGERAAAYHLTPDMAGVQGKTSIWTSDWRPDSEGRYEFRIILYVDNLSDQETDQVQRILAGEHEAPGSLENEAQAGGMRRRAGTWSLPLVKHEADEVAAAAAYADTTTDFDVKYLKKWLYEFLGDDLLFDVLDRIQKERTNDPTRGPRAAAAIRLRLKEILDQYDREPGAFRQKFDDDALATLRRIVSNGGVWNSGPMEGEAQAAGLTRRAGTVGAPLAPGQVRTLVDDVQAAHLRVPDPFFRRPGDALTAGQTILVESLSPDSNMAHVSQFDFNRGHSYNTRLDDLQSKSRVVAMYDTEAWKKDEGPMEGEGAAAGLRRQATRYKKMPPPVDSFWKAKEEITGLRHWHKRRGEMQEDGVIPAGTSVEVIELGGVDPDGMPWVTVEWVRGARTYDSFLAWHTIVDRLEPVGETRSEAMEGEAPSGHKFNKGDIVIVDIGHEPSEFFVSRVFQNLDALRTHWEKARKRNGGQGIAFDTWLALQVRRPTNPDGPWYDLSSTSGLGAIDAPEEFLRPATGGTRTAAGGKKYHYRVGFLAEADGYFASYGGGIWGMEDLVRMAHWSKTIPGTMRTSGHRDGARLWDRAATGPNEGFSAAGRGALEVLGMTDEEAAEFDMLLAGLQGVGMREMSRPLEGPGRRRQAGAPMSLHRVLRPEHAAFLATEGGVDLKPGAMIQVLAYAAAQDEYDDEGEKYIFGAPTVVFRIVGGPDVTLFMHQATFNRIMEKADTPGPIEGEASARWRTRRAENQFFKSFEDGKSFVLRHDVPCWTWPDTEHPLKRMVTVPAGATVVVDHHESGWELVWFRVPGGAVTKAGEPVPSSDSLGTHETDFAYAVGDPIESAREVGTPLEGEARAAWNLLRKADEKIWAVFVEPGGDFVGWYARDTKEEAEQAARFVHMGPASSHGNNPDFEFGTGIRYDFHAVPRHEALFLETEKRVPGPMEGEAGWRGAWRAAVRAARGMWSAAADEQPEPPAPEVSGPPQRPMPTPDVEVIKAEGPFVRAYPYAAAVAGGQFVVMDMAGDLALHDALALGGDPRDKDFIAARFKFYHDQGADHFADSMRAARRGDPAESAAARARGADSYFKMYLLRYGVPPAESTPDWVLKSREKVEGQRTEGAGARRRVLTAVDQRQAQFAMLVTKLAQVMTGQDPKVIPNLRDFIEGEGGEERGFLNLHGETYMDRDGRVIAEWARGSGPSIMWYRDRGGLRLRQGGNAWSHPDVRRAWASGPARALRAKINRLVANVEDSMTSKRGLESSNPGAVWVVLNREQHGEYDSLQKGTEDEVYANLAQSMYESYQLMYEEGENHGAFSEEMAIGMAENEFDLIPYAMFDPGHLPTDKREEYDQQVQEMGLKPYGDANMPGPIEGEAVVSGRWMTRRADRFRVIFDGTARVRGGHGVEARNPAEAVEKVMENLIGDIEWSYQELLGYEVAEVKNMSGTRPGALEGEAGARWTARRAESRLKEFSSVQLVLPEDLAQAMKAAGLAIRQDDVYEDPKDPSFGREDHPHVTVKWGLHTDDADAVRQVLAGEGPVTVSLGELGMFEGKGDTPYDVLWASVESPDLERLNKLLKDRLPHTDTHPVYKPHATVAYVLRGKGKEYLESEVGKALGQALKESGPITVDSLEFSGKSGQKEVVELAGMPRAAADAHPELPLTGERSPEEQSGALAEVPYGRQRNEDGEPVFQYRITWDEVTPASARTGDTSDNGIEEEGTGTLAEIARAGKSNGVLARSFNDVTPWWSSDYDTVDFRTGAEKSYALFVKGLSKSEESELNVLLGGEPLNIGRAYVPGPMEGEEHVASVFRDRHPDPVWGQTRRVTRDFKAWLHADDGAAVPFEMRKGDVVEVVATHRYPHEMVWVKVPGQQNVVYAPPITLRDSTVVVGRREAPFHPGRRVHIDAPMEGEAGLRSRFMGRRAKKGKDHEPRPIVRTIDFRGLEVSVEFDVGDEKPVKDGTVTYTHPYGEIRSSQSLADGDPVDVYVNDDLVNRETPVFIVSQLKDDGTYDEDKVLLGFPDAAAAKSCYQHHAPPWGFGAMSEMTWDQFVGGYLVANQRAEDRGADKLPEVKEAGSADNWRQRRDMSAEKAGPGHFYTVQELREIGEKAYREDPEARRLMDAYQVELDRRNSLRAIDRLRPVAGYWYESEDGLRRLVPDLEQKEPLGGVELLEEAMNGDFPVQRLRAPVVRDTYTTNDGQLMAGETTINCIQPIVIDLVTRRGWTLVDAITAAAVTCERCLNILLEEVTGEPYHDRATAHTHCELCAAVDPEYEVAWLSGHPEEKKVEVIRAQEVGRRIVALASAMLTERSGNKWNERRAIGSSFQRRLTVEDVIDFWKAGRPRSRKGWETDGSQIAFRHEVVASGHPNDFVLYIKGGISPMAWGAANLILQDLAPGWHLTTLFHRIFLVGPRKSPASRGEKIRGRLTDSGFLVMDDGVLGGEIRVRGGVPSTEFMTSAADFFAEKKKEHQEDAKKTVQIRTEKGVYLARKLAREFVQRVADGQGTPEDLRKITKFVKDYFASAATAGVEDPQFMAGVILRKFDNPGNGVMWQDYAVKSLGIIPNPSESNIPLEGEERTAARRMFVLEPLALYQVTRDTVGVRFPGGRQISEDTPQDIVNLPAGTVLQLRPWMIEHPWHEFFLYPDRVSQGRDDTVAVNKDEVVKNFERYSGEWPAGSDISGPMPGEDLAGREARIGGAWRLRRTAWRPGQVNRDNDPAPSQAPSPMYTGISAGRLRQVLEQGLKNPILTDSPEVAMLIAQGEASVFQEQPAVLEVTGLDASLMMADLNGMERPWDMRDRRRHGYLNRVMKGKLTWADTLRVVGTTTYRGTVPPESLRPMSAPQEAGA